MTVRQLTADDATVYQALRLFALEESPEAFSSSYSDEAKRSPDDIAARVAPEPDGSRCVFGAFAGDRLVGFLAFIRPDRPKLHHWADLAGMYVAPEFRRRGLGGALVDAALAHARALPSLRQVRLSANASNQPARSLYQSRGFKCVGVEPEALSVEGRYYDLEVYVLRLAQSSEP
jgi:ribosomal protein S18 acetylase RimI-like enzyme